MGVLRRAGEAAVVIEGIVASASFNQASSSVKLFRASTSPLPRFTVTFTLGGLGGSGCFQTLEGIGDQKRRYPEGRAVAGSGAAAEWVAIEWAGRTACSSGCGMAVRILWLWAWGSAGHTARSSDQRMAGLTLSAGLPELKRDTSDERTGPPRSALHHGLTPQHCWAGEGEDSSHRGRQLQNRGGGDLI